MNMLDINEINILPVKPHNGLVAFASFVINNQIYIGNIAVYSSFTTEDGFRLVYPDKVLPNGKRISCVHPISRDAGESIKRAVVSRYLELASKMS